MRIAFVSIAAPGHLNPMTTLARQMKTRGHDVVFSSLLDTEGFAHAAGLSFVPLCEKEFPAGSVSKLSEPLSRLQGQAAMEYTFQLLANVLQNEIIDLPQTLSACGADAVVLDEADTYLSLVPMHLGMPYVSVSNALPFDFSGQAPLCLFDSPFDPSPAGLARNREQLKFAEPVFASRKAVGRAYAEKIGLEVDWTDPFATISKLAWLTQMPKEFDFRLSHWPPQFHYTGPFQDGAGRKNTDFPWDRLTGEPLVYASMGTMQNGLEPVFSTIAEGVGERPGVQLILSIGPGLDPQQIRSLPKKCDCRQQCAPTQTAGTFRIVYHTCGAQYRSGMPYAGRSHGCGSNHERSTWGCREDRLHEDWNSSSFSGVGGFCDKGPYR